MKTAMQELKERLLIDKDNFPDRASYIYEIIGDIDGELLETEKQQIIEVAKHGVNFDISPYTSADDYFDKTFNQ